MDQDPEVLALDQGNTRTKLALFRRGEVVRTGHIAHGDTAAVKAFLGDMRPAAVVVGSVAAHDEAFTAFLGILAPLFVVRGDTKAPVVNAYGTPTSLGADRLANAVGAAARFPGRPVLAIDLGTCITYDVVEADGRYVGGAISPGMRMRAQAMNAYSTRLPLVVPEEEPALVGTSTTGSLASGVFHGVVSELQGFVHALGHERPEMAVVLTGGDAPLFMSALKSGIFAIPLLTLEGLYAIIVHHRPELGPAGPGGHG